MRIRMLFLSIILVAVSTLVLGSAILAHNYAAPYLYLSGIYSATPERISYVPASDMEMEWLSKQITDKDKGVRAIAAGALGQANNKKAVDPLLEALTDKALQVRMNATMAFFHVKDPRSIPLLCKIVADPEAGFGLIGASYSLAAQGDEGINALIDTYSALYENELEGAYGSIAEALWLSKGSDSVNWASSVLKGSKKKYYPIAVLVLSDFDSEETPNSIKEVLNDPVVVNRLRNIIKTGKDSQLITIATALLQDSKDSSVKPLINTRKADKERYTPEEPVRKR